MKYEARGCYPSTFGPFCLGCSRLGRHRSRGAYGRGLTVEDAALSIGVAKQTLSDLEAGKETVGLGLVLRITRELGIALFVAPAEQRERFRRILASTGKD